MFTPVIAASIQEMAGKFGLHTDIFIAHFIAFAILVAVVVFFGVKPIMKQLEESGFDPDFPIYSLYTCGEENVAQLEKHLNQKNYPLTKRLQIGSSIGSHVGPGLYGITYVAK